MALQNAVRPHQVALAGPHNVPRVRAAFAGDPLGSTDNIPDTVSECKGQCRPSTKKRATFYPLIA